MDNLQLFNEAEDLKEVYSTEELQDLIRSIEEEGYDDTATAQYLNVLYYALEGDLKYVQEI